jgi:sn-glycerol 3-phosphate transport system ATP-binding protein
VVYVTHDQVEAMSMADRIALIRAGRVEQEGSPEDLYARPQTLFAARFIGTPAMNLLALADGPEGAQIRGSREGVLRGPGAGLILGIRPEHVSLVSSGGVAATVSSSEYHGADTIVTARVGEESLLLRAPGRLRLDPGAGVRVAWDPASAHVFDAATERRVDLNQFETARSHHAGSLIGGRR